jgi:predicted RNA-binding protein YlqC (UPF0109 family)
MPDYVGMVRFLMAPLLENTDSLRIDCETSGTPLKVWVRVAFDSQERGRVFGRGGRNIQAIRTVLRAMAALSGHVAHLDVYGGATDESSSSSHCDRDRRGDRRRPPRPVRPRKNEK